MTMRDFPWQPRYWPVTIGFVLLRLLALLPYRVQMALGRAFGGLLRRVLKSREKVARRNLELCFPELDPAERERMLADMWASLGCMLPETALAWWASDRRMQRLLEHLDTRELERLGDQGQGVVLLGAHFTHLELGGRILCLYHGDRKSGLYREHGNPALQWWVTRSRSYPGAMFRRDETRAAVRHLRKGGVLWYAPDQDYERGESVFAPFFGVNASTTTSAHHLARMGKAVIMVVQQERTASGYRLTALPPLPGLPSPDPVADCQAINAAMEDIIRRCPEQYLWIHRRFKNRPEGEAPIY